jgi:hypothetical protein
MLAALACGVVVGTFFIGRQTAPAHDPGWQQGYNAGYDEGVATGRALQAGEQISASGKDIGTQAFQAGYRAGLEDSFGSYDGGWSIGAPYLIVMGHGIDGTTYRIASRELLQPGVTYRLCADKTSICVG